MDEMDNLCMGLRTWPPRVEVIDDRMAEMLRALTPQQRWQRGRELMTSTQAFVRAAIRSQHPSWGEREVLEEMRRRASR